MAGGGAVIQERRLAGAVAFLQQPPPLGPDMLARKRGAGKALASPHQSFDPAEQAAQLLFRIGFGILCIVLPLAAIVSRRALVVVAPIGIVVLLSAALMMKRDAPFQRIGRAIASPAGLAVLFLLFWSALSLAWTPYPLPGAERLARLGGSAAIALFAVAALPERMRASNLYLTAIGVGCAAAAALGITLLRPGWTEPTVLERGAILICLLAWPAAAWLAMKRRTIAGMAIAGGVGALALALQGPLILPALLLGAVLLGGALNSLRGAAIAFAAAATVLIMAAPAIALVVSLLAPQESEFGRTMQVWADIIVADPLRLVTGHGVETALRNRLAAGLDPGAPTSLLFEIWYELGVLGALALTAAVAFTALGLAGLSRTLGSFTLGCLAFAFALSVLGLGTSQTWWVTALTTAAIAFVAVANGEYRTERPAARARLADA
jgi:hypothetical protein